ncbi:MAG: hypothetical protein HY785_00655 [Oscillatoriophycideae cyanobacterium NC_groundwater_1537_Pr4_S-0.65um_50_18]|nr:hypothetical protein [Oscillatoriophycideae cyanobacterium NC_groundwater_1537_Pr4_S-0.65um_50_18]
MSGLFYSTRIAYLDHVSDEDFANIPIHYCDGRNNNRESAPAVAGHL